MKIFCLLFLLIISFSCTNKEDEKAALLSKEIETTPLLAPAFDSLLHELESLSNHQQVEIILNIAYRDEIYFQEIKKQEKLLLEILSIASKEERKKILQRLIVLYQKLDQLGFQNSAKRGVDRCEELENKYSLSKEERRDLQRRKAVFLNRQGAYKESIAILYDLLKMHRVDKENRYIAQDLYEIATYFLRLGDIEKGLLLFKEAYIYFSEARLPEQQSTCLSFIIATSFDLKRYNEVIDICDSVMKDSTFKHIPSFYSTLASSYLKLQMPDRARFYLTEMAQRSQKGFGMVFYCRMAETYISENCEDSVTFYLEKAIIALKDDGENSKQKYEKLPWYFMYVYPSYASLLQSNGKTEKASKAFHFVEPLMRIPVAELERMEYQIDAFSRYSSFCISTGQYRKATELLVLRDSIQKKYNEERERRDAKNWTGRFEIQELTFDNEKKQEEINNTKRISSIIATVSFILFGFTVVTVCMYRYIRKQNKKLRENQAQMALLLNPKPVVVKKREPLTPQEQLLELASKTVKSQKLFLNSKLTLDELAEILGTNRSTLSSCINQCAKCNFNKWINNYRIDYIKKRITATSNSRDLCTEAGFNSINTFTNSFKERLGCTPGEYIDRCKYETLQEDTQ